jgi:hypothetical protein
MDTEETLLPPDYKENKENKTETNNITKEALLPPQNFIKKENEEKTCCEICCLCCTESMNCCLPLAFICCLLGQK